MNWKQRHGSWSCIRTLARTSDARLYHRCPHHANSQNINRVHGVDWELRKICEWSASGQTSVVQLVTYQAVSSLADDGRYMYPEVAQLYLVSISRNLLLQLSCSLRCFCRPNFSSFSLPSLLCLPNSAPLSPHCRCPFAIMHLQVH